MDVTDLRRSLMGFRRGNLTSSRLQSILEDALAVCNDRVQELRAQSAETAEPHRKILIAAEALRRLRFEDTIRLLRAIDVLLNELEARCRFEALLAAQFEEWDLLRGSGGEIPGKLLELSRRLLSDGYPERAGAVLEVAKREILRCRSRPEPAPIRIVAVDLTVTRQRLVRIADRCGELWR